MSRRKPIPLLVCALSALAAPAVVEAKPAKRYHLALGGSLATGAQPSASGTPRDTRLGYADQLTRMARGVRLVDYGCGGATTASFIRGRRPCDPPRRVRYRNRSPKTSQLAAAERFLRRHRRRVAFVTVGIGMADVARCGTAESLELRCLTETVTRIRNHLPRIARRLRRAAGRRVPMAAMTLYDPFLALWHQGTGGQILARLSQDVVREQVNAAIEDSFGRRGFEIADAAERFSTYEPFAPVDLDATGDPPLAVSETCRLTWMCAEAPRGPAPYPNRDGHRAIAKAFQGALGKALRRGGKRRGKARRGR